MHEPTYRSAFSHGWHLMRGHKVLWIFGLFAAILGQMGIVEIFSNIVVTARYYTYYPLWTHASLLAGSVLQSLKAWYVPFDQKVWFVWLGFILLSFFCLFVFAAVVSHGALIHSVAQYFRGKTSIAFHEAWHAGVKHFWKLLSLQIMKKTVLALLVFFVGAGVYNSIVYPSAATMTLFVFSLLVSLFLGSMVSLLSTYATGYVMVEEMSTGRAVRSAVSLLKSHGLVSVEVSLLLLVVNGGVAILAGIFLMLFKMEIAFLFFLSLATNSLAIWSLGNTFAGVILTALLMALGSFITVYSTSVWTYLFMKMHHHGVVPRLKLLFSRSRA